MDGMTACLHDAELRIYRITVEAWGEEDAPVGIVIVGGVIRAIPNDTYRTSHRTYGEPWHQVSLFQGIARIVNARRRSPGDTFVGRTNQIDIVPIGIDAIDGVINGGDADGEEDVGTIHARRHGGIHRIVLRRCAWSSSLDGIVSWVTDGDVTVVTANINNAGSLIDIESARLREGNTTGRESR